MDRAPKKKDEFVARLSTTTCIPLVTLQEMSLEKLRMVYQHAKPIMFRPLPANWKRFSKPELPKLYAEKVIPWAGLDPQTYYDHLQWNKDRLVVELTLYAEEAAVSKLPHQDDQAGEPHDSGAVLGMHHLSPVQADLRDGVLREASSRSPEEPREGWLTYLKGELDRWRGGDGRSNSSSRCKDSGACHERDELGTSARWSNAADCGGEGADREAAQG